MYHNYTLFSNACITSKQSKKMKNIPIARDGWSWIECSGVELERRVKNECFGVKFVIELEYCWSRSMLVSSIL